MKVSVVSLFLSTTGAITLKQLAEIRGCAQNAAGAWVNNGQPCTPPAGTGLAAGCAQNAAGAWMNNGQPCTPPAGTGLAQHA